MIKFCKKCNQNLPIENFSKDSSTKDGYNFYCKSCKLTAAKSWKLKNLDRYRESERQWSKLNRKKRTASYKKWRISNIEKARSINAKSNRKRRAAKFGSNSNFYTTQSVIELYGSFCHLCNSKINLEASRIIGVPGWEYSLHIDHLVPLSKNGSDSLENVRPSHAICNLKKGSKESIKNDYQGGQ